MNTRKNKTKRTLPILLIFSIVMLALSGGFSLSADASVTLQWEPSLSNGVIGYNMYRSATPGSGYQRVNSAPIAGTTFTDDSVSPGNSYYYICRAVTVDGTESVDSNEAEYYVEDPNAAPEAYDDTVQVSEDSWVDINPLANDYDADGDFLEIVSLTQPLHGTAEITGTSEIRYTPDEDFFGQATFTYAQIPEPRDEWNTSISYTFPGGTGTFAGEINVLVQGGIVLTQSTLPILGTARTREVLGRMRYDYWLPGQTEGVVTAADIPIVPEFIIADAADALTTILSSTTTPSLTDYEEYVALSHEIVAQRSILRPWMGNIIERMTVYVKAQ